MRRTMLCLLCSIVLTTIPEISVSAAGTDITDEQAVEEAALFESEPEATEYGVGTTHTVTLRAGSSAKDIQAALDSNANGKYGALRVKLAAGNYYLDRELFIRSNTTIEATGAHLYRKAGHDGSMLANRIENDNGGYDATENITIKGGIWDSKSEMKSSKGKETFRFIHAQNIMVESAILCNVPESSHLIVLAGCKNVTITGAKFYGYGDNGDKIKIPKEAIQLDVAHSDVLVPTSQKIKWDDLPCDNVKIINSTFKDFSRGIGSHTAIAGVLHRNVRIENNTFSNLQDSAIRLYNYRDTVVANNTFSKVTSGVLAYTYVETKDGEVSYFQPLNGRPKALPKDYNIKISKNKITNTKLLDGVWGDAIRVLGIKERPLYGVEITGNEIRDAARYGIFATYAPNIVINGGNKIVTTKKHGILVENSSNGAKIQGNNLYYNGESGIAVYCSTSAVIDKNTISGSKGKDDAGIYLYKAAKCTIGTSRTSYNKISSSNGYGIYMTESCTGTKAQYNTVSSAAKDGIGVYKSSSVLIKGNMVTASKNGIDITTKSTKAKVESNKVVSAGENGIWLSKGSKASTISKNNILKYAAKSSKTNYAGIYVFQSGGTSSKANTQVLSNTIKGSGSGSKKDGIRISESAYTTVKSNQITTPKGNGIYVYKSANCTIGGSSKTYNTITSAKLNGIYLTTSCHNGKVMYNKISKAGKDGIGVYSSQKVAVKGNSITASGNGIYINTRSTGSKIESNIVTSAGKHGIWVSSGSKRALISMNTIKSYSTNGTAYGIYVYQSGGTSSKYVTNVTGNKIMGKSGSTKNAKKDGIKVSNASYTTIRRNTVTSPMGTGIYVYRSKNNKVERNKVTNAKSKGIYLTTACDKAKINKNTVSKSSDVGIATYSAPGSSITDNTVTAKYGKRGIWVSKSRRSTVKSNTVKGTKKSEAIVITSSSGSKKIGNKIRK